MSSNIENQIPEDKDQTKEATYIMDPVVKEKLEEELGGGSPLAIEEDTMARFDKMAMALMGNGEKNIDTIYTQPDEEIKKLSEAQKADYDSFIKVEFEKVPVEQRQDFALWLVKEAGVSYEEWEKQPENREHAYKRYNEKITSLSSADEQKEDEKKEEPKKPDTYKGMPVEDYLQKKLDGVNVSFLDAKEGNSIKESMKNMPIENVNGYVYGINQIAEKMKLAEADLEAGKISQEDYDKKLGDYRTKITFGTKLCKHDFGPQVENIKSKLSSDVLEKNPKLLEVGFLGTTEGRDEYLKKVEGILKDSGVKGNEAYWYAKTLLNMKGYEHPQEPPKPKPAPTTSTSTNESYYSGNNIDTTGSISSVGANNGGGGVEESGEVTHYCEKCHENIVSGPGMICSICSGQPGSGGDKEKLFYYDCLGCGKKISERGSYCPDCLEKKKNVKDASITDAKYVEKEIETYDIPTLQAELQVHKDNIVSLIDERQNKQLEIRKLESDLGYYSGQYSVNVAADEIRANLALAQQELVGINSRLDASRNRAAEISQIINENS